VGSILAFLGGLALGVAGAAAVARWQIRRSLARVREAERRARSAERLAEIGAMTGGLAHEIKNPLSTIGLNAQLLAEGLDELPVDAATDPESKRRLSRRVSSLRREVERLRGILADFLDYAGELRLDRKGADLNRVVEELADFFLPQAEAQGVRLRTDLATGELTGSIDVPHVKQAVLNLMLNAVQAMASPTKADASSGTAATEGRAKELILRTERGSDAEGGPTLCLHVTDTGPGIDPEVMPRLFTPYFTTKSGGTGLGLPTTRRIIEAHGGRLDVVTERGRGTDFVVVLPG